MGCGKYLAFFARSFKAQMMYRGTTLVSIVCALLSLIVQTSLWRALIQGGAMTDTTLPQMVAFLLINTTMLALTRSQFANELGVSIRDGSVVMHLLRPASFQLVTFSTMLGQNAYRALTVAGPTVVFGGLLYGLMLPASGAHALLFVPLAAMGVLILCQMVYIVGLLAFWMQATWYLSWYLSAGVTFFGGTVVPLWFYPDALNRLSVFLPFRYITFEAVQCYLGKTTTQESALALCIALAWLLLLRVIGAAVWRRVQRKMTINGG